MISPAATAPPADRLGNRLAQGLPYARGSILETTEDDFRKLRRAWGVIAERTSTLGEGSVFNFSGLERGFDGGPAGTDDDDLAPALHLERMNAAALEHLGGDSARDEIAVFNRLTAATYAVHAVLVKPGDTVVGVSASYSHPSVARAAASAGATLVDTRGYDACAAAMDTEERVSLIVLTRLAVTYEILALDEIEKIVALAHERGVPVYVDDAGGARVGPAIYGQPRLMDLGVDVGATGLDKYGTRGPRLGLMVGHRDLVSRIRARGFEMGMEARPMLYAAVRRSLEQYTPARVRDLVATTRVVSEAVERRVGPRVVWNGLIAELAAEDIFELALERAGGGKPAVVPYEATAALAMLLLRDHGMMTVHFAGVPPGTSSILLKFIPPETLDRYGGAEKFADAVDRSLDDLSRIVMSQEKVKTLLLGEQPQRAA